MIEKGIIYRVVARYLLILIFLAIKSIESYLLSKKSVEIYMEKFPHEHRTREREYGTRDRGKGAGDGRGGHGTTDKDKDMDIDIDMLYRTIYKKYVR
jgi:hypothetical protein